MRHLLSIIILVTLTGCGINTGEQNDIKNTNKIQQNIKIPVSNSMKIAMTTPKTLHPIYNLDPTVAQALYLFFDTLVRIEDDGSIKPNIAKYWSVKNEDNSIILTLNENINWHDGINLTAEDVAFSIKTIMNAKESIYKKSVENIANVAVLSPYTLQIWYRQPFSSMLQTLFFPVIPKHIYNIGYEDALDLIPVGSGPYKYKENIPLDAMYLEANEEYFKGAPLIETFEILLTPNQLSILSSFEQGLIDLVYADTMDWGKYTRDSSINIYEIPTQNYEFLGLNFALEKNNNNNIREALTYVMDRQQIIDIYYLGHGVLADTPINPTSYLFDQDITMKQQDEAKVKLLLSKEGYQYDEETELYTKNGVPLSFTLLVNKDNSNRMKIAEYIATMFKDVGISINIDAVDVKTYNNRIYDGNYDMFFGGWKFSHIYDVTYAFHSKEIDKGDNFIRYSNKDMDKLLEEAFSASPNDIKKAYIDLQEHFLQENPYISLYFKSAALIVKDKFAENIDPDPLNIYSNVYEWSIQ
ncbi:hypothetical protein AN640_00270 [Candidatus Epulonipiscium fishelsonii]|uniref:Uncharacterized protein n=1 Tax=Candidatus Epulonipiscium fishelsonii TaxID=77094 RepID=A0ACC8XEJ7_9FIRM|nr:hypothetical protein AN640_00270 [Epulopiscium sp. SCG-D08WGA-EpuloA1]OON96882.1 MAG: hypothetical protein ATN32_06015 [Epulopiscium sp. AS2M-Bin002]